MCREDQTIGVVAHYASIYRGAGKQLHSVQAVYFGSSRTSQAIPDTGTPMADGGGDLFHLNGLTHLLLVDYYS